MKYDKNKCPFAGSESDWSDFCDWMNKEGIYKNMNPNMISFPKSFFFISDNEPASLPCDGQIQKSFSSI